LPEKKKEVETKSSLFEDMFGSKALFSKICLVQKLPFERFLPHRVFTIWEDKNKVSELGSCAEIVSKLEKNNKNK